MTTASSKNEIIQYGNFRVPVTAGLGRLKLGPSVALLMQIIVVFFIFTRTNIIVGLVLGIILLIEVSLMWFMDGHRVTPMQKITERVSFMIRKRKGYTSLIQGALGHRPKGDSPPPGLLNTVRLHEYVDSYQQVFGLIHFPRTNQFAVMFRCSPIGGELHDHDTENAMVADWGAFLMSFASQTGISQITDTTETGPDYGENTRYLVDKQIAANAHPFNARAVRETAGTGTSSGYTTRNYVTITFEPNATRGNAQNVDAAASEIARRMRGIMSRLSNAGAGFVEPMTRQQITEYVKYSYDPSLAKIIETARVQGTPTGLTWDNAGPTSAEEEWDYYRHGPAVSVSWEMSGASKGTITHHAMRTILSSHPDFERKRVTQIFRVIDSGWAAEIVERDVRNAKVRADNGNGTGSAQADYRAAIQTRNEQASGAALVDFTTVVTVTVMDHNKLEDAVLTIEDHLAPDSRMTLRQMFNNQAAGFAVGLGVGLDARRHSLASAAKSAIN